MFIMTIAKRLLLGILALSLWTSSIVAVQLSKQAGDRLQRKINEITNNAAKVPVTPMKTIASEEEVNSYLAFNLREKIPRGLTHPEITIIGESWLAGRVLIDIDEFKRHRNPQGLMDPFNYISGTVPLTARGVLRTNQGRGQFELESAEMLGFPLPQPVVKELVAFFSRTPENPNGFDIDAPFNFPAKIRDVVINKGEAVVIQ
jgi:hypothetical protein